MRRFLLVCALVASALVFGSPARAGGWAVTYLDPVPELVRPGVTYTIGSWVLQHGNHPYIGDDSELTVGLRFTGGGRTLTFDAVRLKEPAHYATAVSLPAGTWTVTGVQEWFAPFELGTLTVPGTLKLRPPDAQTQASAANWLAGNQGKDPWGAIRPPGIGHTPATAKANPATLTGPDATTNPDATTKPMAATEPERSTIGWSVVAALGALALGVVLWRAQSRRAQGRAVPPKG